MARTANTIARLKRGWLGLLRRVLHVWVRARCLPSPLSELKLDPEQPVCYLLETYALSSLLILEQTCREHKLPRPLDPLRYGGAALPRRYGALRRFQGIVIRRQQARRSSELLRRIVDEYAHANKPDIQIVPVTVLVGRAPDKETSLAKVLFSENWDVGGRIRRLFSTLINGRSTFVQFGQPLSLAQLDDPDLDSARLLRKTTRLMRTHFRRVRTAAIGPDRSHRRTLIESIIRRPAVQEAVATKARKDKLTHQEAEQAARDYAEEIAAHYSYTFIRVSEILLTWFWNRIYQGIEVKHFSSFREQAPGHEVVYVPCHRSHIDYLLVSYVLYRGGFVPPHVAAGINLNLPLLGPLLRRGGAFFIRRSFRSLSLYTAVFNEYMVTLLNKGVHLEYFIEGARSRTGRPLPPRAGMLAMTVRGYLQQPERPVMFQPIYIGYERLVEGGAYIRELSGQEKSKESWRDLITSVFGILRRKYGRVHVNFGEPIMLGELLDQHRPDWEDDDERTAQKPSWLTGVVDDLAQRIMVNINNAADVNPVNLLAICLLAARRKALDEGDLRALLAQYLELLPALPYSSRITVTQLSPQEIIDYGIELNLVNRQQHELGDVIRANAKQSVLLTYFRNNVAHLVAVPSLVASCFLNKAEVRQSRLVELCRSIYPFLQDELFLPWSERAFQDVLDAHIGSLGALGLIGETDDGQALRRAPGGTDKAYLFKLVGQALLPTLERFYITLAVLKENGSGSLDRSELERYCQLTAERLTLLHHYEAPEFFDRTLFRKMVDRMSELGLLARDRHQRIVFDQRLEQFTIDAKLILNKDIRHTILQIAPKSDTSSREAEANDASESAAEPGEPAVERQRKAG